MKLLIFATDKPCGAMRYESNPHSLIMRYESNPHMRYESNPHKKNTLRKPVKKNKSLFKPACGGLSLGKATPWEVDPNGFKTTRRVA